MSAFDKWWDDSWGFLSRNHAVLVHERIKAMRREILTEAAERAVKWWTTPMQEWHNERLMNPRESIRRAVMGEEI